MERLLQTALGRFIRRGSLRRFGQRRWQQINPRRRARHNVAHHDDLDGYALFLDADQQYSCASFESPDQSLDDAKLAKKRHLAAKQLIAPHTQILEIGCGWGGVAMYLAQHCGARVTGVTVKRQGVVPMTQNYIAAEERRLRADRQQPPRSAATRRRARAP